MNGTTSGRRLVEDDAADRRVDQGPLDVLDLGVEMSWSLYCVVRSMYLPE